MPEATIRRFGVAGYPVAHSRSPQMHMAAYAELGIDADYQRLPIPPELFEETVRALAASGFNGINVTIPHKEAALAIADSASERARAIRAANTLTFVDGLIEAENTDAPALIDALVASRPSEGARALVLGAGGTARAASWALKDAGAEVSVWNRTAERAEALADQLGVTAVARARGGAGFDMVVNTTSVGMDGSASEKEVLSALGFEFLALEDGAVVVDFVYRTGGSPLSNAARSADIALVEGTDLLARQAALSFEIWFNQPAPLATMRAALT